MNDTDRDKDRGRSGGADRPLTSRQRCPALRDYGYDEERAAEFAAATTDERDEPARVVESSRGSCRIVCGGPAGDVEEMPATTSGSLLHSSDTSAELPSVGDWIVARRPPDGGSAQIRAVLSRRTAFARKAPGDAEHDKIEAQVIAANIDIAVIVAAAGRDWNPRRVERYLTVAYESGARVLLAITKADLAEDIEGLEAEAELAAPCVPRSLVCALDGRGMDVLREAFAPALSVVLLGSSGAGKSTLLNTLAGEKLADTGEVRADDQRGRHTTTRRQLYKLDSGALVIDTPGLRELQLLVEGDAIDAAFPEIEAAAELCRFRDCRHASEPGRAVIAAVESGAIDRGRYESWRKLGKESAFLRARVDHAAKDAERRRWKSIEKSMRPFRNRSSRGG